LVQKKPLLILVWRISGPSQQGKHYDKVVSPSRSAVVIYIPPWRALKSLPQLRPLQPLHKYELKVRQGIILSPASHRSLRLMAVLKEEVIFMAPRRGYNQCFMIAYIMSAGEYEKKHFKGLQGISGTYFDSAKELKNSGQFVYRFFIGFSVWSGLPRKCLHISIFHMTSEKILDNRPKTPGLSSPGMNGRPERSEGKFALPGR